MGRAVGLALASKTYKSEADSLSHMTNFSNKGNEVVFATIGDASTSEGIFWEAVNAAGVLQIPLVISVWDDGYGISVSKEYQTTKGSISEVLSGFQKDDDSNGINIYTAKAWDYASLVNTYKEAVNTTRNTSVPAIVHITEVTQPLGHSTSGSHERYKDEERLLWEKENDCLLQLQNWILKNSIASEEELDELKASTELEVKAAMKTAWDNFIDPIRQKKEELIDVLGNYTSNSIIAGYIESLKHDSNIRRARLDEVVRNSFIALRREESSELRKWYKEFSEDNNEKFNSFLFSQSQHSPQLIKAVNPEFSEESPIMNGFEILQRCFEQNFNKYPELVAFGEDLGKIGGVNQGFAGLQEKFGENRIFDTGIRESTIMGQGIGMAMRGLRPIAEIQYLDYIVYGLQQLTDELATLPFRTKGGQKAPVIIRTRGHRLEGIWHTGSPMGMILGALRGIHVLVPRNMTQASGFYNTLIAGDEPGLVIEPLNGYRLKEKLPDNIGEFKIPIGKVEALRQGTDVTVVTYGACVNIAEAAAKQLDELGISMELIDVQSLLPFDRDHNIVESLKKTNRVVFLDEDVPGAASAFMLQKVLEEQSGYKYLDSKPITLSATEHRTGYGSEYNHFSKPMAIDVVEAIYKLMHEGNPKDFPKI